MKYAILTALLAFAGSAVAAPPAQPQPPAQQTPPMAQPEAADVSDEDLDKFATIYVDIEHARVELQEKAEQAESAEEVAELQREMDTRLVQIIEERDWTINQYNTVARAVNGDAELRAQAIALIEEKS